MVDDAHAAASMQREPSPRDAVLCIAHALFPPRRSKPRAGRATCISNSQLHPAPAIVPCRRILAAVCRASSTRLATQRFSTGVPAQYNKKTRVDRELFRSTHNLFARCRWMGCLLKSRYDIAVALLCARTSFGLRVDHVAILAQRDPCTPCAQRIERRIRSSQFTSSG